MTARMSSIKTHPATLAPDELLSQCEMRTARRSGPGGQHRNKVETAVILRHRPTNIQAEANERRSQAANKRVALNRLRIQLALSIRRSVDLKSSPSLLWQERCSNHRIVVSTQHVDFPSILAESLDALYSHDLDIKAASDWLDCTSSQLIKLLKSEPKALTLVNNNRREQGLRLLK